PESIGGNARLNHAAVLRLPSASDQPSGFQAIKQASDVGIPRDEPATDPAAGQAILSGASKDAQDVVLRGGEVVGLEQDFGAAGEGLGGAHQADKDAFLERGLGAGFRFGGSLHEGTI